jgi:predicted phosphate transport protein (TIGR00153 family)
MNAVKGRLLAWFENRRKSTTLNIAQKQITKAIYTVTQLNKAILAFSAGKKSRSEEMLQRLFSEETEIDTLRKTVFSELTKGELPPKYREDLKGLVEHLDLLADYVKDSGRSLRLLMNIEIPSEIMNSCVEMSNDLVDCASKLEKSIEFLGVDPSRALDESNQIDAIEDKIDKEYFGIRTLFFKYSNLDNPTLMTLNDLIEFMERTADLCADTADHIRVLAVGEEEG